jgi:hypothetical protein
MFSPDAPDNRPKPSRPPLPGGDKKGTKRARPEGEEEEGGAAAAQALDPEEAERRRKEREERVRRRREEVRGAASGWELGGLAECSCKAEG